MNDILNFLGHSLFERILSIALLASVGYLAYRWVLEPVYISLRGMWNFWKLRNQEHAILEVIPPQQSEKSPLATQQLFSVLQRLIGKDEVMSLEIDATREEGIRYLICAYSQDITTLQRQLATYLPEAQFRVLESSDMQDDVSTVQTSRVFEIKQARHYAYPLQAHEALDQSDPASYIAGAMTKLEPGERITLQMVIAPHFSRWTSRLYNKIHSRGQAVIDGKIRYFIVSRPIWVWVITVLYGLFTNDMKATLSLLLVLLVVSLFVRQEESGLTIAEQEMFAGILDKLGQPLFRTDIRILVSAEDNQQLYELSTGITSSLAVLETPIQGLRAPRLHPDRLGQKIGMFKLKHRMPSFLVFDSNIFSASELASIYHFPFGKIKTEGMAKSSSRTLPAPLAIKNGEFDVILGYNQHHGEENYIGLSVEERARHMFVIGSTGCGKTTLLQYAILQDIKAGRGVAVIDPHGDMAEMLLEHIPEERLGDVVYFNPDDLDYPIGLNLLELPSGLNENDTLRARDRVAEAVVSLFRKTFSTEGDGGHRIEDVLRNAVHTAFTVEGATLFTVLKLLRNAEFRKQVVSQLQDDDLKDFWQEELGQAGEMQRVKMSAGVTTKISRFQRSAAAKLVLEQPKSTIDFEDIMNSGKILICNFSKGDLGEDTSELFGIATLTMIQLATYRRSRIRPSERKPFYLYVDEFQNFATPSFAEMLAEARKYKLALIMAEQTTSQQDDKDVLGTILGNAGNMVCFRTGNPDDEKALLPRFRSFLESGEIASLPAYNFYMSISAQKVHDPFSGITLLPEDKGSTETAEKSKAASRKNYAKKYVPPKPKENPKGDDTGPTAKTSPKGVRQTAQPRDRLKRTSKPTVYQMAAKWMMSEIDQTGFLKQEVAAHYIIDNFDRDCIEQTEHGNPSISKKVRDAFKKLHRGTVKWVEDDSAWRKSK